MSRLDTDEKYLAVLDTLWLVVESITDEPGWEHGRLGCHGHTVYTQRRHAVAKVQRLIRYSRRKGYQWRVVPLGRWLLDPVDAWDEAKVEGFTAGPPG